MARSTEATSVWWKGIYKIIKKCSHIRDLGRNIGDGISMHSVL